MQETRLPFKPYLDGFNKTDMDERQELYRQLSELVWSPESIGLGGGEATSRAQQDQRKAFYGVTVAELIKAELVEPGAKLFGSRSGQAYQAEVLADGRIKTSDGQVYETLSGAADNLTGKNNNGWAFWEADVAGQRRSLAMIRDQYLEGNGGG